MRRALFCTSLTAIATIPLHAAPARAHAAFSAHGTTPFALNLHPGGGSNRGRHQLIVAETGAGKTAFAAFIISQHRLAN